MTRPELRTATVAEKSGTIRASLLDVAKTRISDAVLMGLFMVVMLIPGTPLGVHTAAMAALVFLASFRRPTRTFRDGQWYVGLCAAILLYLAIGAFFSGITSADVTRFIRIILLMTVGGFIGSGRIDLRSGLRGIAVVLIANVPLFYAGLLPDNYGGLLTGVLGDKNVAGLTYAIFTILLMLLTTRLWTQVLVLAGGSVAVVLTDSRTSIAALAAGVLWLVAARYLNPFLKVCLAVAIYLAFEFAETNFAQVGGYVAREGSDALRERIDGASLEKVNASPWFGAGLGEAQVTVAGDSWFFHNAYWGLLVEGGYPLIIGVLALVAFAGMQFNAKGAATRESRIVEASAIVLLLCSFRLGETFFSIPGFMVIGVGLAVYLEREREWRSGQVPSWSTGLVPLPDEMSRR
ncbi:MULTISPECIES: O-antigen ligase family protein [unclassified Pseudoclavibacter]|uniref:O-antigen ligase family protein n=1 Tax=unclassified Pseudoclavibacter TaxID=2615177 RepID=UPI001BACEF1C|nr:O-antigen ligase family protein [Pseudoclavibacter sp. Marseille-Q4354]MBS3180137.1 O-antigen ligase family protein [Pseudoclavibacter sp. Marseille-Q4354]